MNFTGIQPQLFVDAEIASAFPPNFVWGSATASYQIEGAAHTDGRGPSIWDTFAATPGKVYQGDNGDVSVDHYHRMQEDVEIMAQLGLQAYRFSIAWPRILPAGRGAVNSKGLDFYERLVDALLARGIAPYATLYHWDLPQALEGGWLCRDTTYAFADYAEIVAKRLGDRIAGWITLNEPWCIAYLGYGIGIHAPGVQDRQAAIDAGHHTLLAHGLSIPRIRAHSASTAQVGITLNLTHVYPADKRPETLRDMIRADNFVNRWFLDPLYHGRYPEEFFAQMELNPPPVQDGDFEIISVPTDFLGVNNYSRFLVRGKSTLPLADGCEGVAPVPGACYTDMGWEIYPQGLRDLLIRLHHEYHVPAIYVTENGAAFKDYWNGNGYVNDPRRVSFIRKYIRSASEVFEQGVPLKGYFVWSLLDNFEWAEGYSKRFGIVYVDYPTQRRIIKDSGHWYAQLISAYKRLHTR